VRVWLLHDDLAKKVATIYNTRRDKVNDSTAKYAYSETKEQEIARRLVNGSEHLGQDNIEVLANSVSAGSHKLTAFTTISRALETSRKGGPVTAAYDVEAQSSSLISARDSLVKVCPQYGKVSTPARQDQRSANIASTTVVIYGLIGAMSTVYAEHIDPDVAFKELVTNDDGAHIFAWDNEIWSRAGVVTPSGPTGHADQRNSFPARRAAIRVLQEIMGYAATPSTDLQASNSEAHSRRGDGPRGRSSAVRARRALCR
jgi:hypothetical protein